MTDRVDLDALTARHAELELELARRSSELDDTARLLADARTRARLPVLDNLRVAAPCSVDWAAMTGDDRVRACGECNQRVFNLTAMSRDEAEALLGEGRRCVRYFQRADGTIMTRDCTPGAKRRRRRRWVIAGATVTIASTLLAMRGDHDPAAPASFTIAASDEPELGAITTRVNESPPDRAAGSPVATDARDGLWVMGLK